MRKAVSRTWLWMLLMLTAGATATAAGPTHRTAIKDQSSMTYLLIHPLHRVEAVSKDLTAEIDYDDATHTVLRATFSADISTFDSGNSSRDSHAMEVLDALTFPDVSYKSTAIESSGPRLLMHGDLTFHGQTHPVDATASAAASSDRLTVEGSSIVSLTAFGIERPSLLMIPTEDSLRISFKVVFPVGGQ
jgi:polyisoprenoid-binding protein YceI